jgi:hypothetical protein
MASIKTDHFMENEIEVESSNSAKNTDLTATTLENGKHNNKNLMCPTSTKLIVKGWKIENLQSWKNRLSSLHSCIFCSLV